MSENFLEIVDRAVAGRLGTDERTAVGKALAGENAVLPDALQAAVLAVEVADLAAAHAHVAGGNVDVRSDVAVESGHEALAEAHDFSRALAGGIEVGTALGAADGKTGERVLESLLEAEELDDAGIDVLLETQASRVGADRAVELAAVADVGVSLALIVGPDDAEREHPLRLDHTLEKVGGFELRVLVDDRRERAQYFLDGLDELGFARMLFAHIRDGFFYVLIHCLFS